MLVPFFTCKSVKSEMSQLYGETLCRLQKGHHIPRHSLSFFMLPRTWRKKNRLVKLYMRHLGTLIFSSINLAKCQSGANPNHAQTMKNECTHWLKVWMDLCICESVKSEMSQLYGETMSATKETHIPTPFPAWFLPTTFWEKKRMTHQHKRRGMISLLKKIWKSRLVCV